MGRKPKELLFPDAPIELIDALLFLESDIRYAVHQARAELCLISSSSVDSMGGGRGVYADKTAEKAIKAVEALRCVTLPNGRDLKNPEMWLSLFDDVRQQAKREESPELILKSWSMYYAAHEEQEKPVYLYTINGRCVSWVRWRMLEGARERGLIKYPGVDFLELVEAAAAG